MKLLWLSRHEMSAEQLNALRDAYGEIDILQINKTFDNVQELVPYVDMADILAVVLPLEMVAELLKITDKPVIYAVNGREFTADGKVAFTFKGWRQYKKVVIETVEI